MHNSKLPLRFAAVLLLSTGGLLACGSGAPSAPANAQTAPKEEKPAKATVAVRVAAVENRRVPRIIEISGSLSSPDDSQIGAEVEGKVVRVVADLGDRVKQGQLLAEINPEEFRMRMDQAEALSQQAQANLKRVEQLAKTEMVAPAQLDDARSVATQARAAAELARKKFQDTQVKAPFAGAVAKRTVSSGEYVRVGQQLFQIVVLDPLKLSGEVPERFLDKVHAGDEVTARVDAYPNRTFTGKINRISPMVSANSRSFTVQALISNKDAALKPGVFAKAELNVGWENEATVLPEAALSAFAGVSRVYRIEGNVAREVRVELDQHLPEGFVMVQPGALKAGDRVAVEGLGKLSEGAEVTVR